MSAKLFVLGVLSRRPVHGYELKEIARTWELDKWASVSNGSIYHALERLAADGLIENTGTERNGRRPPRSMYRITRAGRAACDELVRDVCSDLHNPKYPIDLGLAFLDSLPARERRAALTARLEALERLQTKVKAKLRALDPEVARSEPWSVAVLQHDIDMRQAEIRWNRRLLDAVGSWRTNADRWQRQEHR